MDKEFKVKLGLSDQEFFRKYHAVKERVEKQEVKVPVSLEFDGERSAIDEAKKSVSGETIEIKARIKGLDSEIKDAESSLEALQKYSNIDIANKKSAKEAKEAVERVNATIDEMAQKLQSLEGKGDKQGLIKYAKEVYQYLIAANEEVRKFNENTSGKRLEYFDDGSIADVVDEFEKSYKELNELSENFYKILDGEIKAPKIDTSGIDKAKARLRELSEEKRRLEDELGKQAPVNINTEVNESGLSGQLQVLKEKLEGVLNNLFISTIGLAPEAIDSLKDKLETALKNITIGIKNKDEVNDLLQKLIDIQGADISKGISFSDEDNQSISESTKIVHKLGLELKKISEYIDQVNGTPIEIQYKNFDEMNLALESMNSEFKKIADVLSKGIKISKAKKTSTEGIDSLIEKLDSQVNEFKIKFQEILNNFTIESINVDPDTLINLKSRIQESLREISVTVDYLDPKTPEAIEKVTKIKSEFDELKKLNSALDTIIEKVTQKNELFTEEKTVVSKSVKSELLQLNKLIESLDSINERLEKIQANANVFSTLSSLSGNLNGTSSELAKLLANIFEASNWVRKDRGFYASDNWSGELERGGYINLKTGKVDNLEYYDKSDEFGAKDYARKRIKKKYNVSEVGSVFDTSFHTHPIQEGFDVGRDGAFSGYIEKGLTLGDAGSFVNDLYEGVNKFMLLSKDLVTILDLSDLSLEQARLVLDTYADIFDKKSKKRKDEWNRSFPDRDEVDRSALTLISDEAWAETFSKLKIQDGFNNNGAKNHLQHIDLFDFIQGYGASEEDLQSLIVDNYSDIIQGVTDETVKSIKLQNAKINNADKKNIAQKIYKKSELASAKEQLDAIPLSKLSDDLREKVETLKKSIPEWGRKRENQEAVRDFVNSAGEMSRVANDYIDRVEKNKKEKYSKKNDGFSTKDLQRLKYAFSANEDYVFDNGTTAKDVLRQIETWKGRLTKNDYDGLSELAKAIKQKNSEDGRNYKDVKKAIEFYKQNGSKEFEHAVDSTISGKYIASDLKDNWAYMPKKELDWYLKQAERISKEDDKRVNSNQENTDQLARQAKAAKELLKYLSQIRSSNIMSDFDVQDILKNITDKGFDKITGNTISSMEKTLNGYKNKKVNTLNFNDEQVNLLKNYNAKIADMDDILTNKISTAKTKEEVIKLISQFYNLEQQAKETWQAIGNNKSEVKLSKIDTLIRRLTIDLKNAGKAPRKLRGEAEALISQLNEIREATIKNNSAMTELDSIRLYHLQNEINRVSVGLQEFRGKGFLDKIKASFTQASAQFIGYFFSLPDLLRYARQIFDVTREVDTAMIELKKVSNDTSSAVERSFSNMTKTAKDYGSSISNIISLTANWSRLGYNLPDSQELARVTQLYTNVGDGISSEQASESLISTLQGFKLAASEAESIIDKFNEVKLLLAPLC